MEIHLITKKEMDNEDKITDIIKTYLPEIDIQIIKKTRKLRTKNVRPVKVKVKEEKKKNRLRNEREPLKRKKRDSQSVYDYRFDYAIQKEEIEKIVNHYAGSRDNYLDY